MGVAMTGRIAVALVLVCIPLVSMGLIPEEESMLEAFDQVLTAMAFTAAGLCVFAIAWAGFVLMAEGSEERGGGRARSALVMAVVGLVLVLSAKGVSLLVLRVIIPSFS